VGIGAAVLVMIDRPCAGQAGDGPAFRVLPADAPALRATDLGATRGDGIFETAAIRDGHVQASADHLTRFARSAAMLDLPAPDPEVYAAAVAAGIAALDDSSDASVKYVLTRGDELNPAAGPTGWALLAPAEDFSAVRRDGVAVVLLSRGYSLAAAAEAPWLLQGAKTLSYAVNRAALREARRRGAADVLFTTTDGYVLEGPTSSVVVRLGDTLVTPPAEDGVLPGTTQIGVFEAAAALGLATALRPVTVADLTAADAVWLTSSVRLVVAVTSIDGVARPADLELTAAFNAALMRRTD
jgi:4-amino-4-deoxychorismate lyase